MSFFSRQHRNGWRLFEGDSQNLLKLLAPNSLDSMVTDPPAAIGMQQLKWDHNRGGREQWIAWLTDILKECYRVLKPGAHALIWALPRTSSWTATAIEDAGFQVRDYIAHLFFTGFPKSVDIQYSNAVKHGVCLSKEPAAHVVRFSKFLPLQLKEGKATIAVALARIPQEEEPGLLMVNGKGGGSRAAMVMSSSVLQKTITCSNIDMLWKNILGVLLDPTKQFITEVEIVQIIGLKIWSFVRERITQKNFIPQKEIRASGCKCPACIVINSLNENVASYKRIPMCSAQKNVFSKVTSWKNVCESMRKIGNVPYVEPSLQKAIEKQNGLQSSLKPACEFWILARKPLTGPIANNVLQWGTGALNIDGCRIETADNLNGGAYAKHETKRNDEWRMQRGKAGEYKQPLGRFPANLVFSHSEDCQFVEEAKQMLFGSKVPEQVWQCVEGCPVKELNEQAGVRPSGGAPKRRHSLKFKNTYSEFKGQEIVTGIAGSKGEASRFFYCAKPSKKERNAGCEHLPTKSAGECTRRKENSAGLDSPRAGAGRTSGSANFHPTLKSIGLMRYLVRLITPPGGTVLDPFAGSGTTGCAARIEGFRFVGMEKEQDYSTIARARIAHWNKEVQLPK